MTAELEHIVPALKNIRPTTDPKNITGITFYITVSLEHQDGRRLIGRRCKRIAPIGNGVTLKCGVYLWDGLIIKDDVFIGPVTISIIGAGLVIGDSAGPVRQTMVLDSNRKTQFDPTDTSFWDACH